MVAEANRIFGFEGWSRETVDLRCIAETRAKQGPDCAYLAKVRITVDAEGDRVMREGTGAGYATAATLAEAHALAAKEAETDATKRALMTFGNPFGLALYDRDQKGVHTPRRAKAEKALWELRDAGGEITGRYSDASLCERALLQAIEAATSHEELDALRHHNQALDALIRQLRKGRGARKGSDLATAWERRRGELAASDGATTEPAGQVEQKEHDAGEPEPAGDAPGSSSTTEKEDDADRGGVEDQAEATAEPGGTTFPPGPSPEERVAMEASETAPAPTSRPPRFVRLSGPALVTPRRIRAPEHLKWVRTLPCLVCQRTPADAHHLKHVQPNAMSLKPGDQWVVPLCRIHHRELHDAGDEEAWWKKQNIEPRAHAESLWSSSSPTGESVRAGRSRETRTADQLNS